MNKVNDEPETIIINKLQRDPITELKNDIKELIRKNPFYDVRYSDFDDFMLKIKDNSSDSFTESIINKYIKTNQITKNLFLNVINDIFTKFEKFDNDKNIKMNILYFLYFFLSNRQTGEKNLINEKIKYILENILKNKKENAYSFIITLFQMCTFSFYSFFLTVSILDLIGNQEQNIDNFTKIMMNEDEKDFGEDIENINNYVNNIINQINDKMNPNYLNYLVLSDFLNKIDKNYKQFKQDDFFKFDLDKISKSLIDVMNVNNYLEIFFYS